MLTLVPPVFVSVSVVAGSAPTVTLPKLMLLKLSPKTPGLTPFPDTPIVSVGFEPFEVMVTVPLAAPVDCGAKPTVKVVLCDALRVNGVVRPLRVNPVPLMLACEMLTLEPPVLVRVTVDD
jgi:hypothetical protein